MSRGAGVARGAPLACDIQRGWWQYGAIGGVREANFRQVTGSRAVPGEFDITTDCG